MCDQCWSRSEIESVQSDLVLHCSLKIHRICPEASGIQCEFRSHCLSCALLSFLYNSQKHSKVCFCVSRFNETVDVFFSVQRCRYDGFVLYRGAVMTGVPIERCRYDRFFCTYVTLWQVYMCSVPLLQVFSVQRCRFDRFVLYICAVMTSYTVWCSLSYGIYMYLFSVVAASFIINMVSYSNWCFIYS